MYDVIQSQLDALNDQLTNALNNYNSQVAGINQQKCILSMAMSSPLQFNDADNIVIPEASIGLEAIKSSVEGKM